MFLVRRTLAGLQRSVLVQDRTSAVLVGVKGESGRRVAVLERLEQPLGEALRRGFEADAIDVIGMNLLGNTATRLAKNGTSWARHSSTVFG